jgi:ABC-2 type transport system ATP-binding protein
MHEPTAIPGIALTHNGNSPAEHPETLRAEELKKSYGSRQALKGLTFSLRAGSVLGFLGPNGAGKTTAIRILTTILEPSSGRFTVAGIPSDCPREIRRRIGVLPESLGFPKSNTAIEFLTYFGQLHGQPGAKARARARTLLDEVGLKERGKSQIGTYSRGMRQRLGIARALVNDPVVVFLDEPTLGLDPRGQKELLTLVRRIAEDRNASIVLCSHMLSEIENVCDDVVILNSGQVVANGSVTEIIRQSRALATQAPGIRVHVPVPAIAMAQQALEAVREVARADALGGMPGWIAVDLVREGESDPSLNNRILAALIHAEVPILSFQAEAGRLQEAFLHLTDEAIR